jgi:hypothetical protein
METDPRLFSNVQQEPARILPSSAPVARILPSSAPVARILPSRAPSNAPSRSRSMGPKPLPKQTIKIAPASSSSQGDEMRAIIALLDGPERAKSAEPTLQPTNPQIETLPAPKLAAAKKVKVMKQLKAQDKKPEHAEILKKGMQEFFVKKQAPAKTRAATVPPKRQMPALSFDEIAAELEQGSFLDNPVGLRKRDTRQREEAVMRSSASGSAATPEIRPRSGSTASRPALRAAAERPSAGTRILKTQRADSEGQRRITRATMLR